MDHLPAPRDFRETGTVRFVCSKPYDGGSFLEYPIRENKPYLLPLPSESAASLSFLRYQHLSPRPDNELEDLFQTWLFFGLIHEIVGDLCTADSFIRRLEDNTVVVSTLGLLDLVGQWVESVKSGSSCLTYDHIAQCLHRVSAILRGAGPSFDQNIKLSIASVGELLEFAANEAFGIEKLTVDNKSPGSWRGIIANDYWVGLMQRSGWCPSQINFTLDTVATLQVCLPTYDGVSLC